MKPIGGFFELELPPGSRSYHPTPLSYKSGRAAFNAVLDRLRPQRVFVPYYCCDALLVPLRKGGITHEFYGLDGTLEPLALPVLSERDLFVYVDYFGLKGGCVQRLSAHYQDQLVVDATHAFYRHGDGRSWLFNSCRKFFGVPDGAYLYAPQREARDFPPATRENTRYRAEHLVRRLEGDLKDAYPLFQENEALLDAEPLAMSRLTHRLLSHVDYARTAETRRHNFQRLRDRLDGVNCLPLSLDPGSVPYHFPFLPKHRIERQHLWDQGIYALQLWRECLERPVEGFGFERRLAADLLPLPLDQRLIDQDMDRVADQVLALLPSR